MNSLKAGDRVILKADHLYETGKANPCEGSEWFCEGEVVEFLFGFMAQRVRVKWGNGIRNSYSIDFNCLKLVDDMEVCI